MATDPYTPESGRPPPPHPLRIAGVVVLLLMLVSLWANWYTDNVSLPRYCDDTEQALQRVGRLLTERRPAGDAPRRPYLTAAKLLFLVPRQGEETIPHYLQRLRGYLAEQCR